MPKRTAIVLFNLGGPDSLASVRPFLFNLFNDRAILRVPKLPRWLLAQLISRRRNATAQKIYAQMGGKSPLLEQTHAQARALEAVLKHRHPRDEMRVFTCMRYWHPMSAEVVQQVQNYDPDHIILLPLYPHYSTTTTASSYAQWQKYASAAGMELPTRLICCYPTHSQLIAAHTKSIRTAYQQAEEEGAQPRILFSAHGLPKRIVEEGDPYQWQIEQTVQAVLESLNIDAVDAVVCYQSRVGPLEWIGPSTEEEIHRAGKDGVPLLVVPIAFVSEHSETLVELDIEYRELAEAQGVPSYTRVPALGVMPDFIEALAELCEEADDCPRICPKSCTGCCPAQGKQNSSSSARGAPGIQSS